MTTEGSMAKTALSEREKEFAKTVVRSLYRNCDVATLEEILAVGLKYEGVIDQEEVRCMNEALAWEIERRKADHEARSADR